MKKVAIIFVVCMLFFLMSGCSKGSANQPGKVTIDGKVITLPYSFGIKEEKTGGYMIQLFNHGKVKCEDLLGGWRSVADGEISFRVYTGKSGSWSIVGIGAHTQMGITVKLVKEPQKIGDQLVLQVPDLVTFVPRIGKYKGKKVAARGVFKATLCGIRSDKSKKKDKDKDD